MRVVIPLLLPVTLTSACEIVSGVASTRHSSAVTQDGEVRILLGDGTLDEQTREPTGKPVILGAECVRQEADSRLGMDTASESGVDLTLVTLELQGGYHHTFHAEPSFRPCLGAGAAPVSATADASDGFLSVNDNHVTFGSNAHAGVVWDLDPSVLGLDGRHLGGTDVDLFGGS